MFLPFTTSPPITFHPDTTYDAACRCHLHSFAVRLLQYGVGWLTDHNASSIAAKGHEHRRTTCRRARMAWPRDTSDERASLATSRLPHQVQTVQASVNGRCSEYISEVLVATSALPGRSTLRSASTGAYDVPRTKTEFDKRAFSVAGLKMWNELPVHLRQWTEIEQFKRAFKTHLFRAAYN